MFTIDIIYSCLKYYHIGIPMSGFLIASLTIRKLLVIVIWVLSKYREPENPVVYQHIP